MKRPAAPLIAPPRGIVGRIAYLWFKALMKVVAIFERVCGPGVLPTLMLPRAVYDYAKWQREYPQFVQLRGSLPASVWNGVGAQAHMWKVSRNWNENLAVMYFYNRLGLPYWRERFTVKGTSPQQLPEWGKRPVVIAFLHTGTFALLRFWLRSQGVPAAS